MEDYIKASDLALLTEGYELTMADGFMGAGMKDTVAYFDNLHINHFGAVKLAKDLDHDFVQFLNGVRAK